MEGFYRADGDAVDRVLCDDGVDAGVLFQQRRDAVQQAAAAPAPQVEAGIPGDVVAAIMAAIHAMGNGKYTLKAVRRSKNGWGNAGVNDTTAPF